MKKCVAMALSEEQWTNSLLMKDCGLIPYHFYKAFNYECIMVGKEHGEYPYIKTYLKGMKIHFVDGSRKSLLNYVEANSKEIDLLILFGVFPINLKYAKLYKSINPNGKIYIQLDMNSSYADYILYGYPELIDLSRYCDVIATSSRRLQKHLNVKWPWKIEYIPNGYYDYYFPNNPPKFNNKDNIILTVSNLGTIEKATDVLLESFALIADKITDWKLKLVGPIDDGFKPYIEEFFVRNPDLKDRIIITGPVYDKEELARLYYEAKIFALPSRSEGGTPNVMAEALRSGCAIAITKIDAYLEAIDNYNCGLASEIDDAEGFANVVLDLCNNPSLAELCNASYRYALKNFDLNIIIKRLHELLYGGDNV